MKIKTHFLLLTVVFSAFTAKAESPSPDLCFPTSKVKELAQSFSQLSTFLTGQDQICADRLGPKWSLVIQTLLDLKSLDLGNRREFKTQDALSFEPVKEKNWWEYFTKRAQYLELDNQECVFSPTTIAFVEKDKPGIINFCPPYFKTARTSRIEILMHEVRHFEGFSHVTCTQGDVKGAAGSCDQTLYEGGSYAVGVQTLSAIGLFGKDFTEAERSFARASALNTLQNRFNERAQLKLKESLYLTNDEGSLYEWNEAEPDRIRFIKKLKSPARIFSVGLETIAYPVDTNEKAYRMLDDFSLPSNRLGLFAEAYNNATPKEREGFLEIGYGDPGGFITNDKIFINCQVGPLADREIRTLREPVIAFLNLKSEHSSDPVTEYLLGTSGKLYKKRCDEGVVKVPDTNLTAELAMRKTMVVGDKTYALTDKGRIHLVDKVNAKFDQGHFVLGAEILPENDSWLDMTNRVFPYLYEEALKDKK